MISGGNKIYKIFILSCPTILVVAAFFIFFLFVANLVKIEPVFAQGSYGFENINMGLGKAELIDIVNNAIRIFLSFLGIIAVGFIIYGGFIWMTAGGSAESIKKAKMIIVNAIIGLIIIFLSYAIASFVIGQLESAVNGGGGGGGGGGGDIFPGDRFQIRGIETTYAQPGGYHQNVYLCSNIQTRFNNWVERGSVESAESSGTLNIIRRLNNSNLEGSWQTAGNTVIFKHPSIFESNAEYQVIFPKTISNTQNPPKFLRACVASGGCQETETSFIWNFTSGEESDSESPRITSTYPISNRSSEDYPDENVFRSPIISVNFSEAIDASTVIEENSFMPIANNIIIQRISVQEGQILETLNNSNFEIEIKEKGFYLILNNNYLFDSLTWYRITLNNITDLCNNPLTSSFIWEFKTNDQIGSYCVYHSDCVSNCCSNDVCASANRCGSDGGDEGDACVWNNECASACCRSDRCARQEQCASVVIPSVGSTAPPANASNVCRNILISASFDQLMDVGSFKNNVFLTSNEQIIEGGVSGYSIDSNNDRIVDRTILTFSPKNLLAENSAHQVSIRGGLDGVKSRQGISMNSDYNWNFTTGNTICQIDKVEIMVEPPGEVKEKDLFECAGRNDCPNDQNAMPGNQHRYIAQALDSSGNLLSVSYIWAEIDPQEIINISSNSINNPFITAQSKNGRAFLKVQAETQGFENESSMGMGGISIDVFICENPWPSLIEFPYIDNETNFSTTYCRDGKTLLPNFDSQVVILGRGEVVKEFLFKENNGKDAIGIRVMKNSKKLDSLAWYRENAPNPGNPASLIIDGYEAWKDGRTVYVNAANSAGGITYTNIYLISYNQDAAKETIDIFNQMLNNLRFNTNIERLREKIALQRNVKRWGDINEISDLLEKYKNSYGYYPKLESGSYLKGISVSAWKSWQDTLGKDLGAVLPIDPVNEFGLCPGYDAKTCWNEERKEFDGNLPEEFPEESYIYIYTTFDQGKTYSLNYVSEYPTNACQELSQCEFENNCYSFSSCHPNGSGYYCVLGEWKNSCGNKVTQCGEECDGNDETASCLAPGGYQGARKRICGNNCVFGEWTECLALGSCGNGIREPNETCDDGFLNGQPGYCSANCDILAKTWDSSLEFSEGEQVNVNLNGNQIQLDLQEIETEYIWLANSSDNRVVKLNIEDGSLVGAYLVGVNPSRTAVDISGDVWIANRDSANVTKLRGADGGLLKTCSVGNGPKGAAIDNQGYVWIANYEDGINGTIMKLSGDDTNCQILETINVGGGPYGAVVDGLGNVWISNRGANKIDRIEISNSRLTNYTDIISPYGIAIDRDNNVWIANYDPSGATKLDPVTGLRTFFSIEGNGRGIAVDKNNNIWMAMSGDNTVVNLNNQGSLLGRYGVGEHPIGVASDSDGNIWVINLNSGNATKLRGLDGVVLGTYPVGNNPYTYSDMTGYALRSITMRAGIWRTNFDSQRIGMHQSQIVLETEEPPLTNIRTRIKSAVNEDSLAAAEWSDYYTERNIIIETDRWLQIEIVLSSESDDVSPTISSISVSSP